MRGYDPHASKYSTPGEDFKWTGAFIMTFGLVAAAVITLIVLLLSALT